ncbi:MAG: radical SAM protein [Actinomycetota bacterium]|jgi:anaerobic magnesium-protoporphyrin IX monomethyl ester cyclase|nr:radical SAM protein [Actinomycetota bacterium]
MSDTNVSRKLKKIALVTPPYHSGVVETAGTWPNAAFVYIAGELREAGFEPIIYDAMTMNHTLEDISEALERMKPDVVMTSAYTATYPKAIELLRIAREVVPGVMTGIGGVHSHFMWEEVLSKQGDAVDFVLRGEGERTTPELLRCLNDGGDASEVMGIAFNKDGAPHCTPGRPFLHRLDGRPAAWDLVDWDLYTFFPFPDTNLAVISTSRGCDQACTFCSQQAFWQRSWRARSPEDVLAEIELLRDQHGVGVVMFSDETPTLDPVRWQRILDLMIERETGVYILMETRVDDILRDEAIMPSYHEAGIHHIYVGVERTDQASLDMFKKNTQVAQGKRAIELINEYDMSSETSLVLGLPNDTPETIRATLDLAMHYDPDLAFFLTIAPWPYSDIYAELEPHIISYDYEDYNLVAPVVKPINMTTDELMTEIVDCYKKFYMGKVKRIPAMNKAKRDYFLSCMRLIMDNSYLKQYMGGLGRIPVEIEAMSRRFM